MRTGRSSLDSMAAAIHGFLARSAVDACRARPPRQAVLEHDMDVVHFRQKWENAACMMTAPSGTACRITMHAWTTVVIVGDERHVHCDGRPAYVVVGGNEVFDRDLDNRSLVDRVNAVERYGTRTEASPRAT